MRAEIYILDTRLDTFDVENIEVTSSVTNSQDIEKLYTDFSKSFSLPASPRNNKFFEHYYDADIDNGYDARTKKDGRIEINGLPYRYGKFQLRGVKIKNNKPSSYTVNFIGNLVDLKKKFGKDDLGVIDLSAYDHDFNATNVKTGLQSELFSGDMKYILNPKKQYYYSSDNTDDTDTSTLTNIGWNTTGNVHGIKFTDLTPMIKPIRVIEAIETYYSITLSRDFLGGAIFSNMYMSLVNKEEDAGGGTQQIDFTSGDTDNVNLTTNEGSFLCQASPAPNDNIWWELSLTVTPSSGYESVPYTMVTIVDGSEQSNETVTGTYTFEAELNVNGSQTFVVSYNVIASEEFTYTASWVQKEYSTLVTVPPTITTFTTLAAENTLTSEFIASDNLPKIKVIDFMEGLFKAFKLIAIPQDDGTIYLQTLNSYYQTGTIWDVTKYVDFKESEVQRGEILNEINFKFEDPQTILNQQFKKNNILAYGDEQAKLTDDSGDPLDGDQYDIEVPFETVVLTRLSDTNDDSSTNFMYAPLIDLNLNPAVPETHFFYISSQPISTKTLKFIGDNSAIEELTGTINVPHHATFISGAGQNLLFGEEFNEWNGNLMSDTLYKSYHEDYILGLFNIKRRNFMYSILLPYFILSRLSLADVFKIKGRYYRIDNYTANLLTGKSTFKLINSFDNDLSNLIIGQGAYEVDSEGGDITIIVSAASVTTALVDTGNGTGWVTIDNNKSHINVTVDENINPYARNLYITLTDPTALKSETQIYISQQSSLFGKVLSVDNNNITVDNTSITVDNG